MILINCKNHPNLNDFFKKFKNLALLHITDFSLKHYITIEVFQPRAISLANFLLDCDATA